MNRREFNSTALASLLLPSLMVPRQRVKHIDLSLFCDPPDWEPGRYDLRQPFQQIDLTYATDGRVCVRTGLPVVIGESPEEKRLPEAAGLRFWDHDELTGWRSWDQIARVQRNKCYGNECPKCFGQGRVGIGVQKHPTCDGTGWVHMQPDDPFGGYEEKCNGCRTGYAGGCECPQCEGSGEVYFDVDMGGVFVAPSYHAKVATLGNVEYCVTGNEDEPVRFRADGVDGLLMGLSKP